MLLLLFLKHYVINSYLDSKAHFHHHRHGVLDDVDARLVSRWYFLKAKDGGMKGKRSMPRRYFGLLERKVFGSTMVI